jgi:hypothetical protein
MTIKDDLLRAAAYLAATNDSPDSESSIPASEGDRIAALLRRIAGAVERERPATEDEGEAFTHGYFIAVEESELAPRAVSASPQPTPEPVAWMMRWANHAPSLTTNPSDYSHCRDSLIPLYTHPAPVEPVSLSDEQIGLEEMRLRKDAAYEERNKVVAALARLFPSGIAKTAIEGWSEDWHGCVYIDLPTGQVSWHFHNSQAHLFDGLPAYTKPWDGHDTPEKYRRLAAVSVPVAPALSERTPKDYAIEHAEYMAVAAENLIKCINKEGDARGAWESAEDDGEKELRLQTMNDALDATSEALRHAQNDIYEFRKRKDRALSAVPVAAQPDQRLTALLVQAREALSRFVDCHFTFFSGKVIGSDAKLQRSDVDAGRAAIAAISAELKDRP